MENKSEARFEFRRIVQKYNESFESFVKRLQRQVKNCNYSFPEEHLFDQIIDKCRYKELRSKAFKSNLTLEKLISLGKAIVCTRCGSKDHDYISSSCEAANKNCEICKKRGHLSEYCRTGRNISRKRLPSPLTENDLERSRKEVKKEPEEIQPQIENQGKLPENSEVVPKTPSSSTQISTQNSPQIDKTIDIAQWVQAIAAPLTHSPAPNVFYDCFVGGMAMKLIIKADSPINMISRDQYKRLQKGRFEKFHEDLLPPGFGDCIASFTVKIRLGSEPISTNIFVKEDLDGFIYVNNKTAKKLKLIP